PLSFFKNLIVERSGKHEDNFDVKRRAMIPLVDSARVLALEHGLKVKNTIERYKALIALETNHRELMEEAHQAYGLLMKYRTREGLAKGNSGRYIEISELNKLEKQILKNAFQPIKELQELLEVRFKLAYFN
ncbi:MAG: histidine kinase, partial [Flammeovirgaceae bacterium]|nr:histidine kinase [Flammeovirgaceae bacterium]